MNKRDLYECTCSPSVDEGIKQAVSDLCFMLNNPGKEIPSDEYIFDSGSKESDESGRNNISADDMPAEYCPYGDCDVISRDMNCLFSVSSEMVFAVSYPDGKIFYANPVAIKNIEKKNSDVFKNKISDIFSIKGPDGIVLMGDDTKLNVFLEVEGCYELIELTANGVKFGDCSFILVYGRNISAAEKMRRLIHESEIQYRSTINSIPDGVVVVNKEMEIVIYNQFFADVVSEIYFDDEITGKKLGDVAPFLPGRLGLEYRYVFTSGESLDTTIKHRINGKLTYYEVIKTPIFDNGEVIQVVTIFRDRTKNFHLEELKKEAFFQIEKNMEQFAILNDHVRNPLQAIIGLADLHGGDMGNKIISQAHEIDEIVTKLDAGWIESDKVREMLSRHYGITVKRRPNVQSPIGMMKTHEIS